MYLLKTYESRMYKCEIAILSNACRTIKKHHKFIDHPRSNGQTERVHRIIEDMLWAYVANKRGECEQYLLMLEIPYNNSKHVSTRDSPFMLIYGFHPHAPADVKIHHTKLESTQNFLKNMQDMLHSAWGNIKMAQDRACFYANYNRWPCVFGLGRRYFYACIVLQQLYLLASVLN